MEIDRTGGRYDDETRLAPGNLVEMQRASSAADFQQGMEEKRARQRENVKTALAGYGMTPREALGQIDNVVKLFKDQISKERMGDILKELIAAEEE